MKGLLTVITIGGLWCLALSEPVRHQDMTAGSVEGTVMLAPRQNNVQIGGNRYGRPARTSSSESRSPEDSVLVWLESSGKVDAQPPESPVVLDQKDLKFNPSLVPIRQHGTIRIRNSDPVYHNVFSLSNTKKFDVGRRPRGEYKDETFDKPGVVDVFCDIHSNMHAVIYVMPPEVVLWTKVKSGGSFILSDVPGGNYQLKFYAIGYEEMSIPIEVSPDGTASVGTITLTS